MASLVPIPLGAQEGPAAPADLSRLRSFMAELRRGGAVKAVALGGSITTGYAAKRPSEKGWAALVRSWLEEKAAETGGTVLFRNAGVSGTDSAFAAARIQEHVLKEGADLVILEFAVNDQWLDAKVRGRSYEGLVRRLLADSGRAVVCLYLNEKGDARRGQGTEQHKIAERYGLPSIAWAEGIKDRIASGKENWNELFDGAETIHPNDLGHESIARLVTAFLQEVWDGLGDEAGIPSQASLAARSLPAALHGEDFQYARLFGSEDIAPIENSGWEKGSDVHGEWRALGGEKEGWSTRDSTAAISFKLKGRAVGISYAESDGYRNAEAWIEFADGAATKKVPLDCYVSYRSGYLGWAYREIASFPEEKEFVLHVAVKKSRKTDEGKSANFTGIIVTGAER